MSSTLMNHSPSVAGTAIGALAGRNGAAVRLLVWWFDMRAKQRSRRHLAQLDSHLLRDIGLDRMTAAEESRRSVWQ